MNQTSKRITLLVALLIVVVALPAMAQEGRYMIKFKDFAKGPGAVRAAGGSVVYEFAGLSTVAARLPEQALRGLQNNPNIEFIEVDQPRYLLGETTPYGIPMVQADQVAFQAANAANCKVCIIDSGYYMNHEDLQDSNVTWTDNSGTGSALSDGCGHGTHVAGTIAALQNTLGVIGVVPNGGVGLHIVKVFADDCSWKYSSDLVNALNTCKANGAKVVSMSLGGTFSSRTEQSAFDKAWNEGVLSIAAAGNDGNTRKSYPASYTSVVSVAAIDANEQHATFSQRNAEVDIAAPGVAVLSTVPWKGASLSAGTSKYLAATITGSKNTDGVSAAIVDGGRCTSAGSWTGKVVMCERGDVSFKTKVDAVAAGGGVAAAIYNNVSGGFAGTCDDGTGTTCNQIPAISMSQEDGKAVIASYLGQTGTVVSSTALGSGYEAWDGTSMATPHVSGVAALVWSNFPSATNADIRSALESTAKDLGAAGRDDYFGWGLVQAKAAYDKLAGGSGGGGTTPTCTDADGDGHCSIATGGADCDDNNASVYPGANDTKGKAGRDGIDNDCNGTIDG